MTRHKVFKNVEVFIVEDEDGAKLIADIGELRLHSGRFSTAEDAIQAAAFLDETITQCIKNSVLDDLRQGELF